MTGLAFDVVLAGLAWLGLAVVLATATAVTAVRLGLIPLELRGQATLVGLVGGGIGASLLHRFAGVGPFALELVGRPFPVTWLLVGATAAVAAFAWARERAVGALSRGRSAADRSADAPPS